MTRDDVINNFVADPHEFVQHLIRTNELRHDARFWLADFLLHNPQPEFAEFSWVFLMPWYLSIDFTQGFCNLDCRMCCGKEERREGKFEYISRKQFRKIMDHVPTAGNIALPSNSSDPLMNPDFLQILDILRRCRLPFNTVCNGHYLKPKIISALAAYPYHIEFNVSIDSHRPDKYREVRRGELQPVIDNLTALKEERAKHPESGLSINVMTVGMEDTIGDLAGVVQLCHQIGADKCKVQHLIGNNSPGDFELNPNWQDAVFDALVEAKRLGINLIIPRDGLMKIENNLDNIVQHEQVNLDAVKTNEEEEDQEVSDKNPHARRWDADIDKLTSAPKKKKQVVCSRFGNLHIRFDGTMAPCCHVPYPIPMNVYDKPVYQNMDFLKCCMTLLKGDVFESCYKAVNCHCMQEYRLNNPS